MTAKIYSFARRPADDRVTPVDLVQLARQVARSTGRDIPHRDDLRAALSERLLAGAGLDEIAAARLQLQDEPGRGVLDQLLVQASDTCYSATEKMLAIVIPMVMRLAAPQSSRVRLSAARPDQIRQLEKVLCSTLGAHAVQIDHRFTTAADVSLANPQGVWQHLLCLDLTDASKSRLGLGMTLVGRPSPDWEAFYLIGRVSFALDAAVDLNAPELLAAAEKIAWLPTAAVEFSPEARHELGITAEIRCLGIFPLSEGLQVGEDSIRTYRLRCFLENLAQDDTVTRFAFAEDPSARQIRLFAYNRLGMDEHCWPLYEVDGLATFHDTLMEVIGEWVKQEIRIDRLSLDDYRQVQQDAGWLWIG